MLQIMSHARPWSQTVSPTQKITRVNRTTQSFPDNNVSQKEEAIFSITNSNYTEPQILVINHINENVGQSSSSETLVMIPDDDDDDDGNQVLSDNDDIQSDKVSPTNIKFVDQSETTHAMKANPILNPITPIEYVETVRRQKRKSTPIIKPIQPKVEIMTWLNKRREIRQQRKAENASSQANSNNQQAKPPKKKRHLLRGAIGLLLGAVMFLGQDQSIQSVIDFATQELKDGSFLTQNWANIPIPINMCIYLFGLKNAPEFLRGEKPHLEEHGPFCYFIFRKRRILEFKQNSLTYMERILFEFNPEGSKSLDTTFETINLPIFVSVLVARQILDKFYVGFMGSFIYNSIAMTLRFSGEQWIENITARQFLVARKVPLLEFLHGLLLPLRSVGIPIPDEFGADGFKLANHSFGLTTTLSSGELGPFEVHSKTENGHLLGDIISFKESNVFPGLDEPCNVMTGGDGMFWNRPVEASKLTLFLQPTCGLIPFVKQYSHLLYGAQVTRYKFDDQWFNMSVEESQCYCKGKSLQDCQGYHDISPCTGGVAPMGFSLPHFYLSPNLQSLVGGINPNEEEHASFLDMEPLLGAPVNAKIGIQGVVDMRAVEQVPLMAKLPRVVLPIMWLQVAAGAEGVLGYLLFVGSNFVRYGSYLWLLGGLGYSSLSFYRANTQRKQLQQQTRIHSESQTNLFVNSDVNPE